MIDPDHLKPLIWVGKSRRELSAMPQAVQSDFGYALYVAQQGGLHRKSKPLKGFGGAGVVEIVNEHRGDTYRCIYTVRFAGSVYVLHAFQKKSKKGRETPKAEIELIRRRLREAERIAKGEQP
jgi:phage-related protein